MNSICDNNNNCGCNSCESQSNCTCPVLLTTDCSTLSEDLPCSNILKGQTLTETIKLLDAFICEKFDSVSNFFTLINVGGGSEVYKGVSVLGKKELRTLVDSNLINLVQGTDTITISVDETALNAFIEANQKTYSVVNIGIGAQVYKDSTIVGDNTQFNLRKIKSSDNSVTITEGVDDINLTVPAVIPLTPPLETITEASKTGIAIRGRIAANYGNIGTKAVDLSDSTTASSTLGATGAYSFAANDSTTASQYGSVAFGIETVSSGQGSFTAGEGTIASSDYAVAIGDDTEASGFASVASGFVTIASGQSSNSRNERTSAQGNYSNAEGYNSDALGISSHVGGHENIAGSYAETSIGHYGTQNFAENPTAIVATDRLFNIGNGTNDFSRSNAFTILKNGLATLPSVTNTLISGGSNKSIVTREYLEAFTFTDTNALHKTGNESWTGTKSSTNTGAGITNGLSLTNNGIAGSTVLNISNGGAGAGELITNSSTGDGIRIVNNLSGKSIYTSLNSTSDGIVVNNTGTGFSYIGQNNAVTTFTIDKPGNVTANSFIKTGGTSAQYLMADGSVTPMNPQSIVTTNYTLTAADNNSVIFLNNSAPITITIPVSGLPDNFNVGFVQETANDVTYTGSGISNPVGLKGKGLGYQQFIERKLGTAIYYLLGNTKV